MKKLLPLLVVNILVLSGIGAVALPNMKQIDNEPLNTRDWDLEIEIKCGLFGYEVNVTNKGDKTFKGSLKLNITTTAWIVIVGDYYEWAIPNFNLDPLDSIEHKMKPVIGFGPSRITISGIYNCINCTLQPFKLTEPGFVFLFYISCATSPIVIP